MPARLLAAPILPRISAGTAIPITRSTVMTLIAGRGGASTSAAIIRHNRGQMGTAGCIKMNRRGRSAKGLRVRRMAIQAIARALIAIARFIETATAHTITLSDIAEAALSNLELDCHRASCEGSVSGC